MHSQQVRLIWLSGRILIRMKLKILYQLILTTLGKSLNRYVFRIRGGEAFVRVKFIKTWGTENEKGEFVPDKALPTDNIKLFFAENTSWQQFGEYYYTRIDGAKLGEVSQSDILLESFAFLAGEDDNPYKGKSAHIDVVAEAIQVSNGAMEVEWGMTYDRNTGKFAQKGVE